MTNFEHANEKLQSSLNSPGLVHNHEFLIRIFIKPLHMAMDGSFGSAVITSKDLTEVGFSVFRREYITPFELKERIQARLISRNSSNPRYLGGLGVLLTHAVRSIMDRENNQVFYVLDDATDEGGYSHAIIVCKKDYPKSELTDYKYQLLDMFKQYNSADAIFTCEEKLEKSI